MYLVWSDVCDHQNFKLYHQLSVADHFKFPWSSCCLTRPWRRWQQRTRIITSRHNICEMLSVTGGALSSVESWQCRGQDIVTEYQWCITQLYTRIHHNCNCPSLYSTQKTTPARGEDPRSILHKYTGWFIWLCIRNMAAMSWFLHFWGPKWLLCDPKIGRKLLLGKKHS